VAVQGDRGPPYRSLPMVFSSSTFVFFFLPAVLAAYHVAPRAVRNGLLVAFSLAFYAWGAGGFVFALLLSVAINYVLGARASAGSVAPRAEVGDG
jgi:hypothetical protein